MKKLKKIVAGVLAATITASSLTVGASAKMKLRTVSIDKIEGANDVWSLGDGYYSVNNSADLNLDPDIDQIIYIGKDELESWRKTGKISYKKVKTDVDMTDLLRSGEFTADGEYLQLVTCDKDSNALKRYVVSHNEKNIKITTVHINESGYFTRSDGYTTSGKWNKAKTAFTITVTAPDGTQKSKKLTYKGKGNSYGYIMIPNETKKYIAYVLWKTNEYTEKIDDSEYDSISVKIYGVKKNGKLETVHSFEKGRLLKKGISGLADIGWGDSHLNMQVYDLPNVYYLVYLSDSGRIFFFESVLNKEGKYSSDYGFSGISGKVYESRAIAYCVKDNTNYYFLADLSTAYEENAWNITALSDVYQSMSTEDGKIYLVQNEKGQWGYINKKGKVLAMFDDAGPFIGNYAPVVKNGKAYLIDRNMKQVSEKIDADGVTTFGEGLFRVTKGDKVMLMTYKK